MSQSGKVKITERKDCRACAGPLESIFDLGEQLVINFSDKEPVKAPLHLMKCGSCHLVQLKHTVDQDYLFRHYYYRSGTNASMRDHLRSIVEDIQKRIELKDYDRVVDIGSNDNTLLKNYPDNILKIGFEPAFNDISDDALIAKNIGVKDNYFSAERFFHGISPDIRAKVITAISMFYDLEDPNAFLQDIKKVLAPDGLFVIQMNYLPTMLEKNAVDNICHEHLEYYSLYTLDRLLVRNGLEITDYALNDINGGSIRVYVKHSSNPQVGDFPDEGPLSLDTMKPYQEFVTRININASRLRTFVTYHTANSDSQIFVYGASTRGAILLQLAGLVDRRLIPYAVERNPEKHGKLYLNEIPVISEANMRQLKPDYLLVLPTHFLGEFVIRENQYLREGGAMIIPLPTPYILEGYSLA